MKKVAPHPLSPTLLSAALATCFGGFGPNLLAAPVAPAVAVGQASFAQAGKTLTVTNTPGTIINWQGFSIAGDETTRFIQQNAASSVLNRVTGAEASSILGQLQSNGQVFLINPNGIVVGAGARIDTAGFVASSLDLKDADFIAGRFKFQGSEKAGRVINQGEITTPAGGKVWLIAPSVENSGMITTPEGQIILAAGKKITIADSRYPNVYVEIEAPDSEALNVGKLVAQSGQIGVFGRTVKNAGSVNANAAVVENGKIVFKRTGSTDDFSPQQMAGNITLKASDSLTLAAGSNISADGPQAGEISLAAGGELALNLDSSISANGVQGGVISAQGGTVIAEGLVEARGSDGPGGRISLLGQRVALLGRSRTDASGESGGGVVLVGGDFQGKNPGVENAARTYIADGAEIRANAVSSGDGGNVVVWADETTRYFGSISAKGGSASGNGGTVEVSGKGYLAFNGRVDVSAANGTGGTLLLDPTNITLTTVDANTTGFTPPADITEAFADDAGLTSTFNVGAGGSFAGVSAGSNIVLQATNDITVSSAFNVATATGAANVGLTLSANNNINVNAAVTVSGTGALAMSADADNSGVGTLSINAAMAAQQGGMTLSGATVNGAVAGTLNATGAANSAGGNISVTSAGIISLAGAITTTGGAGGAGLAGGNAGNVSLTGVGGVTTGALTATGGAGGTGATVAGNAGTITANNSGTGNIVTGALTASTGAATATGTGGSAGSVSVTNTATGGTVSVGAVTATGGAKGAGGNVVLDAKGALTTAAITTNAGGALGTMAGLNAGTVTLTGATVTTTGAISATGSNASTAGAGGAGGAVSMDATGGAPTITLGGNITTTGGAGVGSGNNGGAGGAITLQDAVLLNAASVTLGSAGGASGGGAGVIGAGGTILTQAIDSTGGARTLVLGSGTGDITVSGALGAGSALAALTITGNDITLGNIGAAGVAGVTGATAVTAATAGADTGSISVGSVGGVVRTDGTQTYAGAGTTTSISGDIVTSNDNVTFSNAATLGAASTITAGTATVAFSSTLAAGANNLTISADEINFAANVSGSGSLTLQQGTAANNMILGGATNTAALEITTAEFALIQPGFGSLKLGRSDASGTLTVTPITLTQATTLRTGNGSITGSGAISGNVAGRDLTLEAGASGSISLTGALGSAGTRLGAVSATAGGSIALAAVNANGDVLLNAGINLTLSTALSTTSTSNAAIVASAGGNFINNAGAAALTTGAGGRWLVYTSNPATATFGGLPSGNLAIWGSTYANNPPAGITATGNRYLFAPTQTLTFTTTSATKNYGVDLSSTLQSMYTVSGANTNTYGGVVLADSSVAVSSLFSGAPLISSTGAAANGGVAASPHAVTAASGSLSALTGYTAAFNPAGTISVNKVALTVTAQNAQRPVAEQNPQFSASYTGLVGGDSATSIGPLFFATDAQLASLQGSYSVTPFGLASANYNISYVPGALTVGSPVPTKLTGLQSSIFSATSFSVLDPLAGAIGSTGSVTLQTGMAGFLNTLPPSAAGLGDEFESAATGDAAPNGFEPARVQPGRREGTGAGCFSKQPLAQMQCSGK